jgi:hypothetical protein
MQRVLFVLSLGFGALIAYVDARPSWDDTGVIAGALFIIGGVMGFLGPSRPWLWALALGLWIPLRGITVTHNYPSLTALAVAFAGAYSGAFARKFQSPNRA